MDLGTGGSLLLSLLLSAVVAALVTLLIEYAAKPSLEARKERILRERRMLLELKEGLIVFAARCAGIIDWLEQEELELSALEETLEKLFHDLDRLHTISVQVAEGARTLPSEIYGELSFAIGRHQAMSERFVELGNRPDFQRLDRYRVDLSDLGVDLHIPIAYLSAPSRKDRRRIRAEAEQRARERFRNSA